jgi:hypothetical protein
VTGWWAIVGGLVFTQTLPAAEPAPTTYRELGFDVLASFAFDPHVVNTAADPARKGAAEEQVPKAIRQWDKRRVGITGFMMPVRVEKGLVTEFLLMRYTFTAMNVTAPAITEWVRVRAKPGVPPAPQLAITCLGVFKVEPVFESGYLTAVYQLELEKLVGP